VWDVDVTIPFVCGCVTCGSGVWIDDDDEMCTCSVMWIGVVVIHLEMCGSGGVMMHKDFVECNANAQYAIVIHPSRIFCNASIVHMFLSIATVIMMPSYISFSHTSSCRE